MYATMNISCVDLRCLATYAAEEGGSSGSPADSCCRSPIAGHTPKPGAFAVLVCRERIDHEPGGRQGRGAFPWKWWLADVELLYHAPPVAQGTGDASVNDVEVPRCWSLISLAKHAHHDMFFPSNFPCCTGVHHMSEYTWFVSFAVPCFDMHLRSFLPLRLVRIRAVSEGRRRPWKWRPSNLPTTSKLISDVRLRVHSFTMCVHVALFRENPWLRVDV